MAAGKQIDAYTVSRIKHLLERNETTQDDIARRLGVSASTVSRVGSGKLKAPVETEDGVIRAIRERRSAGEGLQSIAADFCMSRSMVNKICIGRLYRKAPGRHQSV